MRPFGIIVSIATVALLGLSCEQIVAAAQVQVVLRDGSIDPAQISAVKNQSTRINVVNNGKQIHNFVVPDFYIFTSNLSPGEQTYVQFKPDKTGTFPYYSDKNGVPEPGMHGTLTVTP